MKDSSEASGDSEDTIDIWAKVTAEIDELRTAVDGKADAVVAGAGIELVGGEISLAKATTESLGGIKVGENLSVDEDGVLSADAQPAVLYPTTGQATDGAMTQKAVTDQLATKQDTLTAGAGIVLNGNEVAIDESAIAQVADIPQNTSDIVNDGADGTDQYVEGSDLAAVEAEIPTTVAELTDSDDYATKEYVDSACSSVYRVKGSVANRAALDAITSKEVGDCYTVNSDNMNYVWTGTAWDQMAPTIDLSGYATKAYVDTALGDVESALATITTGTGV